MAVSGQIRSVTKPVPHAALLGSCGRVSSLGLPVHSVIRSKPTRRTPLTVAHSSVLLPDVSPEANVPPAIAQTIVEYARAMPTWEVFCRAGLEIGVSVLLAFLVVKAIQRATNQAIQASNTPGTSCLHHLLAALHFCTAIVAAQLLLRQLFRSAKQLYMQSQ